MERGRRVAHDDTEWRLVQDANYLLLQSGIGKV